MSPYRFPLALFTFFGLVAVVPVWVWWLTNHTAGLKPASQFLAGLTLPGFILLYLAGWLDSG